MVILTLKETDVRYLASCVYEKLEDFKQYINKNGKQKNGLIEIEWKYLAPFFPKLDKYIYKISKLGAGAITMFFEYGIDNISHNYDILNNVLSSKNHVLLLSLMECMVKIGKKDNEYIVYLPHGIKKASKLDFSLISEEERKKIEEGKYFVVHGIGRNGRIVIRVVEEEKLVEKLKNDLNHFKLLIKNLYEA
ncbi:MAG: hypothetical protein RMJ17_02525 [Candidatus Aenigmarchaeota archaeon]|nr:hypothetical protein [Candidatus Aenigmarchaeota archaeon]MDW8149447.1 hypothetical protein [Candidatus Aenigmarchaeota archaeon]